MLNTKKMNNLLTQYLSILDKLQSILFAVYIKRDYFENTFDYENKTMQQAKKLFLVLDKIRGVAKEQPEHQVLVSRLEHLYEIIFSLDLLKNRLIDHATFEIAENEFKHVTLCVSNLLKHYTQKQYVTALETAILTIENLFQTTLQFVTADPVFFLFFIRDLRAFCWELKQL